MEYVLQALVVGPGPQIPLTEAEFESLRSARTSLTAAFALEEIYDLVLRNFQELEATVLQAAVAAMTQLKASYEDHFESRAEFNQRALNLLNAARLYLDQFPQRLKRAGVDPEPIIKLSNELYDSKFEYRFMEALRNHAQHAGLAVHGVTYNSSWGPQEKTERLQFSVSPYTSRSSLEADRSFKAAVLSECPEKVALVPAARVYVQSINALHQEARERVVPLAAAARSAIEAAIGRHEEAANERFPGLSAIAYEGERVVEEVRLFLDWDDIRIQLQRKNRALTALSRSYVSSEVAE